ncbi:hypothetical protein [Clostridium sp. 1001270J_160509_D11]|uniref:hypothetical protein n=1 Tax=Clostridium sp. 1001270J_160509_D11 TaxID=2787103 RepID=UPI0018AB33B9|nr:hypothetical protein [Clostridium sp. 1001270J_160509_D11]
MKLKKYASMIGAIILAATNMGYIFADDTESDENQPPNEINITEVKTIEGAEIENDEYDRALNLHRQNVNLSQVGVGVKYGHSTISISPSVSFPLGGGISFSKNVQNIGPNPLICYK